MNFISEILHSHRDPLDAQDLSLFPETNTLQPLIMPDRIVLMRGVDVLLPDFPRRVLLVDNSTPSEDIVTSLTGVSPTRSIAENLFWYFSPRDIIFHPYGKSPVGVPLPADSLLDRDRLELVVLANLPLVLDQARFVIFWSKLRAWMCRDVVIMVHTAPIFEREFANLFQALRFRVDYTIKEKNRVSLFLRRHNTYPPLHIPK